MFFIIKNDKKMNGKKIFATLLGFLIIFLVLPSGSFAQKSEPLPTPVQPNTSTTKSKKVVARIWHGRTLTSNADKYYDYLLEAGIKKIESIPGNLGAQLLRRNDGNTTEFTVISYWESRDAIRKFAGNNIEKVHPLPKDNEYLIKPETTVKHFDVMFDSRK
jgi:heme-degrading monooxygenase HmoA